MLNFRNGDPVTSVMAGDHVESAGIAGRQRSVLLNAVATNPGATAGELEKITGIKAHKRLPELRKSGHVVNGHFRKCSVSGMEVMTWNLTPQNV